MIATPELSKRLATFPLFQAILERRSRRFAKGMTLEGGPLAFQSACEPERLSHAEEAALAFAACGVTGFALGELPYRAGSQPESGGGNIMTHFIGRTVPSGDAMHDCTLFVINDDGVWLLKRPQDYARDEIPSLLGDAREHRFETLYDKGRVPIANARIDVPRQLPFVPPFNKWMANVRGTTYFLPVAELSALYINVLLAMFDDEFSYLVLDDHNGCQPAGVGRFARSAGGHLHDNPASGRVATLSFLDTWICEFVAVEQGAMLQNLGLMAAALGLGGFPHFAAHPFIWPVTLGFRTLPVPLPRILGLPENSMPVELAVPTPVGLEKNGTVLIKSYCPPYYKDMQEAVLAFVDYKYAAGRGTFRDGGKATGWRDAPAVQREIPRYSDRAIEATIACCQYIHDRYGRFPASTGPYRTVLAYQAHHLDPAFYEQFYKDEAWKFDK